MYNSQRHPRQFTPTGADRYTISSDRHIKIHVHPQTVPTTGSDFHPTATHVDALGMPAAIYHDEHMDKDWPYHPTPCCGASAKGCDGYIGCRKCYQPIDPAFGNVPVEPFRPLAGDAA